MREPASAEAWLARAWTTMHHPLARRSSDRRDDRRANQTLHHQKKHPTTTPNASYTRATNLWTLPRRSPNGGRSGSSQNASADTFVTSTPAPVSVKSTDANAAASTPSATNEPRSSNAPAVIDRATSTEADVQAAIRDAVVSGRGLTIAENGITRMQIAARRPCRTTTTRARTRHRPTCWNLAGRLSSRTATSSRSTRQFCRERCSRSKPTRPQTHTASSRTTRALQRRRSNRAAQARRRSRGSCSAGSALASCERT